MFDSDFDRRFRQSQRRHDIMFRIIMGFCLVVFLIVISFWIFAGVTAYKAIDQIESQGVKSLVEQIWCGKNNTSCL